MDLKLALEKAREYDDLVEKYKEILKELEKTININGKTEKRLKGYIFDSLVYRYQLARYKAGQYDALHLVHSKGMNKIEAEAAAQSNYERDIMRFCQILDEAIGEHD